MAVFPPINRLLGSRFFYQLGCDTAGSTSVLLSHARLDSPEALHSFGPKMYLSIFYKIGLDLDLEDDTGLWKHGA